MNLVDTHCHLDNPGLAEQLAQVVRRAHEAGIDRMVTIGTRLSTFPQTREIARTNPSVFCTVGVHPHEVGTEGIHDPTPLVQAADDPRVVGIGETGFDYFYDKAPREAQRRSFLAHVQASQTTGLPLVVHTRDADDDTMDLLEAAMREQPFTGVIHCFSSSRRLAERAVALGLHLGIGGIATFPKSDEIRATLRHMPLEALVLETDAPYLAPAPKRGRTNEPAFVAFVAASLADLFGLSAAEIAQVTSANAERLFPRIKRAA